MNYISRLSGVLPALAGVALALSVFGCSGGDGSPTTQPSTTTQPPTTQPPAQTTRNEDIIRNAAANIPVAGSVSQGSRRGQSQQGVVTRDSVRWNGSGGRGIRVTIGSAVAQPDPEGNNTILDDVDPPDGVIDLVTVPNSGSASAAIVHAVSDVSYTATSGEFTPTFSGNRDDPDLVFGIWATQDADSEDITAVGAFADGEETPSAAIPTSGTYTGNLFAFHQSFDSDDDIDGADYSVARVEITVADGSVSGRVSNIATKDDPDSNAFTFIDAGAGGAIVVTMASATPLRSQNGGFFNETTSLSLGGSSSSEDVDSSTGGRWGGQFFGSDGRYIAGTVGLNIRYSDGTSSTVFGGFSAERN